MKWCGRIYSVLIIYCLLICTLNFCISSCPQKKKNFCISSLFDRTSQCSEEWHQHVDLQVVHQSLLYWWAQPGCQTFLVNTSLLCLHPYPLPVERDVHISNPIHGGLQLIFDDRLTVWMWWNDTERAVAGKQSIRSAIGLCRLGPWA